MKLFRIEILDYSNSGGTIQHKVFLNDTEELKYRRSADELIQKQLVKSYKMHELHINSTNDVFALKNLSLSDLKKLILRDTKEDNQRLTVRNKMQNQNDVVMHHEDIPFIQWLKPSFLGIMQYISNKNPKLVKTRYNHNTETIVYKYKLHGIKIPFPIDNRLKYDTTMETTKSGIVIHIYNKKIDYSIARINKGCFKE